MPPVNQTPSRRDDLLLMLLHGGARSPEIANRVVDTFRAEVLEIAADWLHEVGEREAAYLLRSVDVPSVRTSESRQPKTEVQPVDDPGRCLKVHAYSPRDGWRMICGNCDHGEKAQCHRVGGAS